MKTCPIVWSPTALLHFSNWIRHIAKDSHRTAEKERVAILKSVSHLKSFPLSGRIVPEFANPSLRELVKKPIRIIYRLTGNRIDILALHHSKRQFDIELFP